MANPNMIGGGRYTRAEQSGDRRGGLGTVKTSKKRLLLRLWKYLGHNRFLIVSALILSVCSNLLALWGPKLSGQAIDAIGTEAGKVDFASVFKYTQIMLVCYIVSAVISYVLSRVMIHLSRDVVYRMRRDVMNAMSKYPVSFFDKYQPGDIISIVTYDVDTVNQSLSSDLLQIVQSIITVTVSFVMMISIAPRLVIIFAFTVPLTFFFTKWLTGKVRPLFRRRSACLGEMNGYAEQMLSGQKTTKAYGCESEVNAGCEKKNEAAVDAYTKAEAYGTVTGPSVNFINNASLALVSVFGGLLFMNGSILLGDLSSFVQYSRKFSGPINEFANILGELQSSFAAAERVFMLIDAEPEAEDKADAAELTDVVGEVEFSDLWRVFFKEVRVGIMCAATLGIVTFAKVVLIDKLLLNNPEITLSVAFIVAASLAVTIIVAKLIGATLPLLAKKIHLDPAVMASPLITTLVDAVSLLVYFAVAKATLGM